MDLAERHRELDVLTDLYGNCLQNRGRVALIIGGVASGKTQLLNTFADQATEAGAVVLTATATAAEQAIPLGVISQLFHATLLPPSVEQRATQLIREPGPAVVHGLCTLLLDLTKDQPVVLGIDDIQFADEMSLQTLLYLQRRMRSARLLVILNEWAMPRSRHVAFHTEVARLPYFRRLRLMPLSPTGVAEVASRHLDAVTAARVAKPWHEISDGNPLLVHALLEDYLTNAHTGQSQNTFAGDAFSHAVLACLHRWEPELLDVARGIALLGGGAQPRMLARLLNMPADSAAQVIDVLTAAGLLRDGDFRHPAGKTAVLDGLPRQLSTALHVTAAQLLHEDGAPAATVADHLLAANETDGEWAVNVLRDAADRALADGDAKQAAACLDLAHRSCTDDNERAALTIMLARVEWRARPATANRRIDRLRAVLRDGHMSTDNVLTLVKYLLWHGRPDEAARVLRTTISSAQAPDLRADLRLVYRLLSWSHAPAFPRGDDVFTPGERLSLHPAEEPTHLASAALATVLSDGPVEQAVDTAEYVLRSSLLSDETLDTLLSALLTLIHAERADRATPWCDALLEEATGRQATTWQAILAGVRADIAIRCGDPLSAAEYARMALRQMSPQQWGVAIGGPVATLLLATTAMGDYDDAAKLTKHPVPDGMHRTWFAPQYLHARGHFLLATNRVHAALGDFRHCGSLMTRWGIDHPAIAPWRTDVAKALLKLGKPEEAAALATEQLALPGTGHRSRGTALRILATTDAQHRVSLLQQARILFQTCDDQMGLAITLGDLSKAHQAKGRLDESRHTAQQAMEIAKGAHAETLCRELLTSWTALGMADEPADPAGVESLSRAEWRVASLAALGHTNRTISLKLSITVSTVEQHLTRVYRKLNVQRRTELPVSLPLQLTARSAPERDMSSMR